MTAAVVWDDIKETRSKSR